MLFFRAKSRGEPARRCLWLHRGSRISKLAFLENTNVLAEVPEENDKELKSDTVPSYLHINILARTRFVNRNDIIEGSP